MRRAAKAIGLLLLALALAGVGLRAWLRSSLPRLDGTVRVAGLAAPATIDRDAHGIPYIRAESDTDALFALGFVHAQDRLAQMELTRRAAAGRLAELIGPSMVDFDRMMRSFAIYRLAEGDLADLPEPVRAAVDAYTAGVNAFLDGRRGALPLEFQLLWFAPEPWTAADCLIWGRLMALRLTDDWPSELLRAGLLQRLPRERVEALWPVYPKDAPVTIDAAPGPRRAAAAPGVGDFGADGSNAWAVAGSLSATGAPILANDPHLGLTIPNTWYLARLDAPGLTLAGATAPGVPFFVLGHNGQLAWGLTTTHGDAADLFVETLAPEEPGEYLAPGGPQPFRLRNELIGVRFANDVLHAARATRHGPVVSDVLADARALAAPGTVLALTDTALLPGDVSATALYRANRARDRAGFLAALEAFRAPQQNVLYADREGHIGLAMPGRVPIRTGGGGPFPAHGWTGDEDWAGFVPFPDLPTVGDPPSGRILNANNRLVPEDWPYPIAARWPEPYRAIRIARALDDDHRHGLDAAAGLQLDTLSTAAEAVLDVFLSIQPASAAGRAARNLLADWDRRMERTRREPLVYYAWVREAMRAIYADELGPAFPGWWADRPLLLKRTIEDDPSWCDDTRTTAVETCPEQIAASLDAALVYLDTHFPPGAVWGDAHQARFRHAVFGRMPLLRELFDRAIANGGGNHTVNRGGLWLGDPERPFAQIHGPGYRAIYDLSDLDRSRFMHAPGQSGNVFSPHYDDLMEAWRDGRYLALVPPAAPSHRLRLDPARGPR